MHTNIISFRPDSAFRSTAQAANDDRPAGPGGAVVSLSEMRRKSRVVRTLRGVFFVAGGTGLAQAA